MLTRAPDFMTTTFQIDSSGDDGHGTYHEGKAAIVQTRRHALSSAPPKRLPVETVRAQVIQHLSESSSEILRAGRD